MKYIFLLAILCMIMPSVRADTATEIAAQEKRIAALRKEVMPLITALEPINTDVRVFISLDPIVDAVTSLNQLPVSQRTVSLQSTERDGYLFSSNAWCNSYAELQGPGDLQAQGELTAFGASVEDDGSILLRSHASTTGRIQVHLHIYGPRIEPPINLGGGGLCPYGGGNGSSLGASFNKELDLRMRFAFAMAPDGRALVYKAAMSEPAKVDMTISIGLGALGHLGYPASFPIPQSPYAGQFPLLISNGGTFNFPGKSASREYALVLKPASFAASKKGVTVQWNAAIDFKTVAQAR